MGGLPLAGEHKDRPLKLWKKATVVDCRCILFQSDGVSG